MQFLFYLSTQTCDHNKSNGKFVELGELNTFVFGLIAAKCLQVFQKSKVICLCRGVTNLWHFYSISAFIYAITKLLLAIL